LIAGVADTHAALWYLLKNPLLSATARIFIEDAARSGHDIVLSSISLAEIVYLVEKKRLPASAYYELETALADPDFVLQEAPLTGEIVKAMRRVPRENVPDMPDRIIAATGLLRCPRHQPRRRHPRFQRANYLVTAHPLATRNPPASS
jgi:PIN domain nuclease of toxin-antitoxin system